MTYNIYEFLKKADAFTFANMFFGLLSCSFILKGEYETAARLIVVAIVADGFDGYFARKTNTESDFGMNLDSLSDAASFGVAPALLLYSLEPEVWVLLISFVFLACGVLRLARYNVLHPILPKGQYIGIPIPNGAFFLTLAVLAGLPFIIIILVGILASMLMVSSIVIKKPDVGGEFPYVNVALMAFVFTPSGAMDWVSKIMLVAYGGVLVWHGLKRKG